jgi:hypothetical protein
MLTVCGQHHPKTDTDHLYVPINEPGRRLMQIKRAYVAEVMILMEYVESKEDPLIKMVRTHQHHTCSTLRQIK